MTRIPAGRGRSFYLPIAVILGIGLSVLVYQTLNGGVTDGEILNRPYLTDKLITHLQLVLISFGVVLVAGVPLGVAIAHSGRPLRVLVVLVANLGQALPSIGVLVLLYNVLGLGLWPSVIALALYGLLPVLRNTMVGVQGVDPAAVEAARGMGMTAWQSLWQVELPLAAPVIFAGVRTALVLIVGTATLANFIGGHGLGDVINAGIDQSDRIVFVGAVMVAALALMADWALSLVERLVVPRRITQNPG